MSLANSHAEPHGVAGIHDMDMELVWKFRISSQSLQKTKRRTVRGLVMNVHPQGDNLPIVVPTSFDNLRRFFLDILEDRHMYFPEIPETLYLVGSAESQEVEIGCGFETPFHIRDYHVSECARIIAMKDLISLLLPCDDIVDPLGSGRRERGDEGFHHAFIELGGLLDENTVLFGILGTIDEISGRGVLSERRVQTLRMWTSVAGKMTFILTSRMDSRRPKYQEY